MVQVVFARLACATVRSRRRAAVAARAGGLLPRRVKLRRRRVRGGAAAPRPRERLRGRRGDVGLRRRVRGQALRGRDDGRRLPAVARRRRGPERREPPAREARHGERAAVQLGVRRRAAARRAAARLRWHPGRDRQHAERRAPGPRPRRRRLAERVARRRREARPRHGGRAAHGAARDPGRPADAVEGAGPDRVVVAGRRGAGPLPARGAVRRRPRRGRARGGFAADRHRRGRPKRCGNQPCVASMAWRSTKAPNF